VVQARTDRWHRRPTALLGGPALVSGTLLPAVLAGHWPASPQWIALALGAVGVATLGLVDDFVGLRPAVKLAGQVGMAALAVGLGVDVPGLQPLLSAAVALLWIVGVTNALNLIDNMDGLAGGVAAIAATGLALHGLRAGDAALAAAAAALAGASAGFLLHNFPPASIFMGDSGSLFLGYSLAVLSLFAADAQPAADPSALAMPLLVLLVPLFDTTLVTSTRLATGRRVSQGGRDHTSHRLVGLGFSERNAVLLLWAIAALGGAASLALRALPPTGRVILGAATLLLLLAAGTWLAAQPIRRRDAE
jgi:UDP-GlcNAc:undecaprenyl-phosphate GlcNAc-1-phosphate transferase